MNRTEVEPLASYLAARRTEIESALDRYLPKRTACPPIIDEAMRYSLFAGGKRLRPVLALASAESVADRNGAPPPAVAREQALPAACALEMIHTYSLIHDDLPAMDNDSLRRGRPTLHVVYSDGIAILVGDGLLTEAFALLAREPSPPRGAGPQPDEAHDSALAQRKLRTIQLIATAAGAAGMVGGQALDLRAVTPTGPVDFSALEDMHRRKTGALIRAAAMAGAIMVGGSDEVVTAIDEYATCLGLAFQIVDDILDVSGASSELGKTAGKDAAAGKPTYPALYGLDESRRKAEQCLTEAQRALARVGLERGRLGDIASWVVRRTN